MPKMIEPIDKICRTKKRDVLYVTFHPDDSLDFDWENNDRRNSMVKWLKKNRIPYEECQCFWGDGLIDWPYLGQLYLDVPYDENDPMYQMVQNYLEDEQGNLRHPETKFYYLPYEKALENAHHDREIDEHS